METNQGERSLLGRLVTWLFVALLAVAALKLAFWVLGIALGVGYLLVFRVAPLLLAGWLVLKVYQWLRDGR